MLHQCKNSKHEKQVNGENSKQCRSIIIYEISAVSVSCMADKSRCVCVDFYRKMESRTFCIFLEKAAQNFEIWPRDVHPLHIRQ